MAWAPDYITDDELKAFTRIEDEVDDVEVAWAITAASRAVDSCAGRQFGQVDEPEERTYTAQWDRRRRVWVVVIDDLQTLDGLVVEADGSAVTDITPEPRNAVVKGKAWTSLVLGDLGVTYGGCPAERDVTATASWGWASVPVSVKQATALQASRFLARRDSPFGIAGSPQIGSELRLLAVVDPDVKVALRPYTRTWAAV